MCQSEVYCDEEADFFASTPRRSPGLTPKQVQTESLMKELPPLNTRLHAIPETLDDDNEESLHLCMHALENLRGLEISQAEGPTRDSSYDDLQDLARSDAEQNESLADAAAAVLAILQARG